MLLLPGRARRAGRGKGSAGGRGMGGLPLWVQRKSSGLSVRPHGSCVSAASDDGRRAVIRCGLLLHWQTTHRLKQSQVLIGAELNCHPIVKITAKGGAFSMEY